MKNEHRKIKRVLLPLFMLIALTGCGNNVEQAEMGDVHFFSETGANIAPYISTKDGNSLLGLGTMKPEYLKEPLPLRRIIALSFDDGPHVRNTQKTLEILKEKGVKATFFLIGEQVDVYPEIAKQVVLQGHEIGNHSWSHLPSIFRSKKSMLEDMAKAQETLFTITGVLPKFYRPPYGANPTILTGSFLPLVYWSIDPQDWKRKSTSGSITHAVLSHAHAGGIIILHETSAETVNALPMIIDGLREKGYNFKTVGELLSSPDDPEYLQRNSPHFLAPPELLIDENVQKK